MEILAVALPDQRASIRVDRINLAGRGDVLGFCSSTRRYSSADPAFNLARHLLLEGKHIVKLASDLVTPDFRSVAGSGQAKLNSNLVADVLDASVEEIIGSDFLAVL